MMSPAKLRRAFGLMQLEPAQQPSAKRSPRGGDASVQPGPGSSAAVEICGQKLERGSTRHRPRNASCFEFAAGRGTAQSGEKTRRRTSRRAPVDDLGEDPDHGSRSAARARSSAASPTASRPLEPKPWHSQGLMTARGGVERAQRGRGGGGRLDAGGTARTTRGSGRDVGTFQQISDGG